MQSNEIEVRLRRDALDHLGADVSRRHLEDSDGCAHGCQPFSLGVGGGGLQLGGAATAAVGIELLGPVANRGESLELAAGQRGRIGVSLVCPDVHVLLELTNDLLAELLSLALCPFGIRAFAL